MKLVLVDRRMSQEMEEASGGRRSLIGGEMRDGREEKKGGN